MIKLTISNKKDSIHSIEQKEYNYCTREKHFVFESIDDKETLESLSPFLKRLVRQEMEHTENGEYEFSVDIRRQSLAGSILLRDMELVPLEEKGK